MESSKLDRVLVNRYLGPTYSETRTFLTTNAQLNSQESVGARHPGMFEHFFAMSKLVSRNEQGAFSYAHRRKYRVYPSVPSRRVIPVPVLAVQLSVRYTQLSDKDRGDMKGRP